MAESIISTRRNMFLFIVMCMVWGTTWIAIRAGIASVPPLLFAGTRFAAAGVILLIIARIWASMRGLHLRTWMRLGIASSLMITVCYGLLFWGMTRVSSGTAAVLEMSCTPLALMGFSLAFREEGFSWRHFNSIGVGVAGLCMLFGPAALETELQSEHHSMNWVGGAAIIAAAMAYGLGSVIARPVFKKCSPLLVAGVTSAIGGAILLVGSIIWEPGASAALTRHWSAAARVSWLFLVVFGSIIAYTIFLELLRAWGSSRAGTYAFVSPVIAVVLGAIIYGEHVGIFEVAGMTIMLVAAYLAVSRKSTVRGTSPLATT